MKYSPFIFLFCFFSIQAQQYVPFAEQVDEIKKKYDTLWDSSKETIVFTGSSSIRLWKNLETAFPEHQIVNTGFGGSQAVDLLFHVDNLILDYKPKKVFIYEGDNDVFSNKRPKDIIRTSENIILKIRNRYPETKIILISAKPSLSRWHLRKKYRRLNRRFQKSVQKSPQIYYADVWNPMLFKRRPKKNIFVSDGLHMNAKGYDIWYSVIKEYMN